MTIKQVAGLSYQKAETYNPDKPLVGEWAIYWKIDGIRTIGKVDGEYVSRSGKALRGLNKNATPQAKIRLDVFKDCEVFRKDWNTSNSLCMNGKTSEPITQDMIYALSPHVDPRLFIGSYDNPSKELIANYLKEALALGYEGLVLRGWVKGRYVWYRVKPVLTADVHVIGINQGTGKYKDMMGALVTTAGKVGTGFTDEMRKIIWDEHMQILSHKTFIPNPNAICIGDLIQIEYTEKTVNGLPRHPRFSKIRNDKEEESYD